MGYLNKPNILRRILGVISSIIVITGIFALGWFSNILYIDLTNERLIDGLRFKANNSYMDALEVAEKYDEYGDWVCSNVKGMSYQRCVEIASHECGHEIFAEILEKNPDKIDRVMEVIDEN